MLPVKREFIRVFFAILFCLLAGAPGLASENPDLQIKDVLAQDKGDDNEPTAENWWLAKQAGDMEKADRIMAIMQQEAKKTWGGPCYDIIPWDQPRVTPPLKNGSSFKFFNWGNDVTVATGMVSNGISIDYDASGYLYAVRCSTYMGTENAFVHVYKSTDEGATWSWLCGLYAGGGAFTFSHPVIVTGTAGTPDKLYIFYLSSPSNGSIGMARFTVDGDYEGFFNVKSDTDTITYFSACGNYGTGSRLMVAYQKESSSSSTPLLYTLVSSDYGETWGNQTYVSNDGAHPDITYGRGGYTYLVYEKTTGGDYEVKFFRNSNYCYPAYWRDFDELTADGYDDNFPKVACLHTLPDSTPYVWVGYNHDYANSGNIDMRFAYSSNGGEDWTKNRVLANELNYNEMACDLWVGRNQSLVYVNICYLAYRGLSYYQRWYDIYWGYCNTAAPSTWNSVQIINDSWGAWDYDGRTVCQGTYPNTSQYWSGVLYASHTLDYNYRNLYFDHRQWTDIEDQVTEEGTAEAFSLKDNYPNPFNPETRINYSIVHPCQVRLAIFNVLGQRIRVLVDQYQSSGSNQVVWDGKDDNGNEVASGVYFYKLEAGEFNQTKKMVLIR
jgi:hypothetical protein